MNLDLDHAIGSLRGTCAAIVAMLDAMMDDEEAIRWRPPDGAWSIVEIASHLVDEEIHDFRARVRSTLEDPTAEWPPIDPEGWASERNYNENNLREVRDNFSRLREESIAWLRSLEQPNWEQTYQHPKLGPISAGDLLASWVAHDCLHVRQLSKRLYQLADLRSGTFNLAYAGDW